MNKRKPLIYLILTSVFLIATLSTMLLACAQPEKEQVIELKTLRSMDWQSAFVTDYRLLIELGNEMGEGRLIFTDVGGGEAYPIFEQLEPVKTGAVDLLITVSAFISSTFPEANIIQMSQNTSAWEHRDSGLIADLDKMSRKKLGIAVLSAPSSGYPFAYHIYLKEPIKTLDDLKGLKLRGMPIYDAVLHGLGVSTVTIPPYELVTALQTGVVDGAAFPIGARDFGFAEQVKYMVYPPFWIGNNHLLYMNAAKYDSLPDWAKDKLMEIVMRVERESLDIYADHFEKEIRVYLDMGIEPIVLTDEEWWHVQDLSFEGGKEYLKKIVPPENYAILEPYIDKWYPKEVIWPPYDWE